VIISVVAAKYMVSQKCAVFIGPPCIVAKRCVLEQELLLTAYRKSHMRNRLVPKRMTLTSV